MEQYVKINVKESVRTRLKELAAEKGQTLADFLESIASQTVAAPTTPAPDVPDIEALAAKHDALVAAPTEDSPVDNLDTDELPECCQGIYSGCKEDRCEHWILRYGRYYNKLTNRFIDDPAYYNYCQSF